MAMTNGNMAPPVPSNSNAGGIKATPVMAKPEDPMAGVKEEFEDQVAKDAKIAANVLDSAVKAQKAVGPAIKDLTEDDAYNLEVAIAAGRNYSPTFLKIVLKDSNYIARWSNSNTIRQGQLMAQGFKYVTPDLVENLDELEMHLDSRDHFAWVDLVAVYVLKSVYYAGLRKAYVASLHATNNRKASETGAVFSKQELTRTLNTAERGYLSQHEGKPIYNPNIGV